MGAAKRTAQAVAGDDRMLPVVLTLLSALPPTPSLKLTAEVVGDKPLPYQAVLININQPECRHVSFVRREFA